MIRADHRFHGRGSLRFVYQHGNTVRGSYLSLKYARNSRRKSYRVAVVVSRKVHKSAVVRNRIRRRMYEAVRACAPAISDPYDLVFTVFSEQLAIAEYAGLAKQVADQLQSAGVIPRTAEPSHAIVGQKETHA